MKTKSQIFLQSTDSIHKLNN